MNVTRYAASTLINSSSQEKLSKDNDSKVDKPDDSSSEKKYKPAKLRKSRRKTKESHDIPIKTKTGKLKFSRTTSMSKEKQVKTKSGFELSDDSVNGDSEPVKNARIISTKSLPANDPDAKDVATKKATTGERKIVRLTTTTPKPDSKSKSKISSEKREKKTRQKTKSETLKEPGSKTELKKSGSKFSLRRKKTKKILYSIHEPDNLIYPTQMGASQEKRAAIMDEVSWNAKEMLNREIKVVLRETVEYELNEAEKDDAFLREDDYFRNTIDYWHAQEANSAFQQGLVGAVVEACRIAGNTSFPLNNGLLAEQSLDTAQMTTLLQAIEHVFDYLFKEAKLQDVLTPGSRDVLKKIDRIIRDNKDVSATVPSVYCLRMLMPVVQQVLSAAKGSLSQIPNEFAVMRYIQVLLMRFAVDPRSPVSKSMLSVDPEKNHKQMLGDLMDNLALQFDEFMIGLLADPQH